MTPFSRHQSIFFLIMRRLRAPLIALIAIIAVSVLGLTLAPGVDAEGRVHYLSFFHAFYFISYTATTIGFGEILYDFSDQQRLWVTICIYLSVVGWAYTIGTVFSLLADRNLRHAIDMQRFVRSVRRMSEPFYLVCGYGETGRLICDALDRLGHRAVVLELDEAKVAEIDLQNYAADIHATVADAANPETLAIAGLTHPHCAGVIALTNDDNANLAIAIAARLLAPELPALCRAQTPETAANMASFGTRHIIDPFEKFGQYLALALHAPAVWHLLAWLTGLPGTTITRHRDPPRGHWIVCGHGRFGRVLVHAMAREAESVTIIDQRPAENQEQRWVQGDATGSVALREAGAERAVGIVAATGNDVNNLSIAVTAREINPQLFVVARQNQYANRALFAAFDADVTVVPSEIVAHECLAILTTPLLVPFLDEIKRCDVGWCDALLTRLTDRFGWDVPAIWGEHIDQATAPALQAHLAAGGRVALGDLLRAPDDRTRALDCEALLLLHDDGSQLVTPPPDTAVRTGDKLLLAGRESARRDLGLILANAHSLSYVLTGRDLAAGWVWEKLAGRRA